MTVNECTNSTETYNVVADIVSSIPLSTVKEALSKKFYLADNVVDFLYLVFTAKGNGILHGPGGFGKSQITKAFLEFYNIPAIVKVGHSSMDVEAILGIPNIEKLTKESSYEVAFEKSVFSIPGVLILEEFLDVKPTVASALKDILTEGGYRQGNTFTPSKTGSVIICSNKTPEEVSIDLSTTAFYKERFPYSTYVCWDSFTSNDYTQLYKVLYGETLENSIDEYALLADICSVSCNSDTLISPRLAIKARDAFITSKKVTSLQYINSLDFSKIELIQDKLKEKKLLQTLDVKLKELNKELVKLEISDSKEYTAFLYFSSNMTDNLRRTKVIGDAIIDTISKTILLLKEKEVEFHIKALEFGKKNLGSISKLTTIGDEITKYIVY